MQFLESTKTKLGKTKIGTPVGILPYSQAIVLILAPKKIRYHSW
jgi:hypothetical protein